MIGPRYNRASAGNAVTVLGNAFHAFLAWILIWTSAGLFLPTTPAAAQTPGEAAADADTFSSDVAPLLERYCVECHLEDDAQGGIALDGFFDQESALGGGKLWLRVLDAVEGGVMPPADMPRPSHEEIERLVSWVENDFFAALYAHDPRFEAVVIRRLNRQEYDNTIRDLIGLELGLVRDFPADDIGFGYDNIGSALNISPIHVEKYLRAAEAAMQAAIQLPDVAPYPPAELIGLRTYPLAADAPVEFEHHLKPGRYLVDFSLVRVGIDESVEPPWLLIGLGQDRRRVTATRVQDETVVYRLWLTVVEGDKQVHVSLAPESVEQLAPAKSAEAAANISGDQRYGSDRGLHVDSMVVRGPYSQQPDSTLPSHQRIFVCQPEFGDESRRSCAEQVISKFAQQAFRRPLAVREVERLMSVFDLAHCRGESFERSVQVALTAVLVSPQFLFLVEPDDSNENRPLTDYELATRLSYFLWSTMPDQELLDVASRGALREELNQQAVRMLEDPKSQAFVENFIGQWLQLRNLKSVNPDPDLFAGFDEELKDAMRSETEKYFAFILRDNRNVLELLDSDYSFLNETLAQHYGIEGVSGPQFRKVSLTKTDRGGVLTQASILTLTSNPNRTSPVKRGQWILQQILGTPPPPPPPGVVKLDESPAASDAASLRERMELHRANPDCAACHQQMDAIGFALENFDAVGRWRSTDHGFPIDSAGELSGGIHFQDAAELKHVLTSQASKKFTRCLIENMLTYALGRSLEPNDYFTVEEIRRQLAKDQFRIQNIVLGIVHSRAFQERGE